MKERFLRNKYVIMHYYIATTIVILFYGLVASDTLFLDRKITIILLTYLLLFPIVIMYTRKYAVHIFLFMLAFITGFYSFYHYTVEAHSILNALYFTFQLYLLILTEVFTEDGSALLSYPFVVEIARWSAAAYTISTVFIAMYRMLEMSILLTFYQIVGNHIVVYGWNAESMAYIEHLRKKKKRVILIDGTIPSEAIDYLESLKVVVLNPRENPTEVHTKAALTKAKAIVMMNEVDMENLNAYIEVYDHFQTKAIRSTSLHVSIQLQSAGAVKLLKDVERLKSKERPYFKTILINPQEQLVSQLFERHPIAQDADTIEQAHLLIIGFGKLGQQIAGQVIKKQDQSGHQPSKMKVLDAFISRAEKTWNQNYGQQFPTAIIDFQAFDVRSDSLDSLVKQEIKDITQIYVCLPEEHLELWTVIELANQFPHIPIYMPFAKEGIADKWLQSEIGEERLIHRIGTFEDLFEQDSWQPHEQNSRSH